jgi:phage-related minor tail protein
MNIFDAVGDVLGRITDWVLSWWGGDPRVEMVREKVAATCQFLPTVASVAAMLSASNPAVVGVAGIAQAICAAVQASRKNTMVGLADLGPEIGTVNGVPIEGDDLTGGGK